MEEKEGNRGKNSEIRLKLIIREWGKIFRIFRIYVIIFKLLLKIEYLTN